MQKREILSWLLGSFPVDQIKGNEAKFPCPKCGRPNFYFNVEKKIGYCHHAKCHRKTSYNDLINILGTTPKTAGYIPALDNNKLSRTSAPVKIPESWAIIGNELRDQWLVDTLKYRGLTEHDIARFALRGSAYWIYVPVYEKGRLVQYVARRIDRRMSPEKGFATEALGRRYDYFKGSHISDYFFGWDQCRHWEEITLVENTFGSIQFRKYSFTTNFGSHLSNKQVEKISQSKIKTVALLWDEGAEIAAGKACNKLHAKGIPAAYHQMIGQPDDHSEFTIQSFSQATLNAAEQGVRFLKQWTANEIDKLEWLISEGNNWKEIIEAFPNRTEASLRWKAGELQIGTGLESYYKNVKFFKKITPLSSYWAGFIAADGCLNERDKVLIIQLSNKDHYHLESFVKDIKYNGPIQVFHQKTSYGKSKFSRLNICSAGELINDLNTNFNLTSRKTYDLKPPNLEKECALAYIAGYIDGDGSISARRSDGVRTISIGGRQDLLLWIKSVIDELFPKENPSNVTLYKKEFYQYRISEARTLNIYYQLTQLTLPLMSRKWNLLTINKKFL